MGEADPLRMSFLDPVIQVVKYKGTKFCKGIWCNGFSWIVSSAHDQLVDAEL